MSLFLDESELRELTGRVQRRSQMQWLEWNGWKYAIRADGRVMVAREQFELKMLDKPTKPRECEVEPDWDAMNR